MKAGGFGNCLGATADTQLAVNVAGMNLDRAYGEDKPLGDFGVGQPCGDEAEDIKFAWSERVGERIVQGGA